MHTVLLDSDRYLLSYSTFTNPFELDVHHMTSQISSISTGFTQTSESFFRSFFKSLDHYNSGMRTEIKKR